MSSRLNRKYVPWFGKRRRNAFLALGAIAAAAAASPASALTLNLTDDAYTGPRQAEEGGAGPGKSGRIYVGNTGGPVRNGLARFDLSAVPAGSRIVSAQLRFFVNEVRTSGAIAVFRLNGAWAEATVNSANIPPVLTPAVATAVLTGADVGKFVHLDVTQVVKDWLVNPATNFGLGFGPASQAGVDVQFDSKESTGTAHAMEIEVAFEGPAGPQGQVGDAGPQGPAGPAGPQGAQGPKGEAGAAGADGPAGPAGAPGPVGPIGAPGPAGPAGPAGAIGAVGPAGPVGVPGLVGPPGPVGPVGATGPIGPAGAVGPAGAQGPVGPVGPQGASGPVGAPGPAGPTGPAGAVGAVGPMGPAGPSGPQGMLGPQGLPGATGPQGDQGPQGVQGPAGPAGTTGQSAAAGANFASGSLTPGQFVTFPMPNLTVGQDPSGALIEYDIPVQGGGAAVCLILSRLIVDGVQVGAQSITQLYSGGTVSVRESHVIPSIAAGVHSVAAQLYNSTGCTLNATYTIWSNGVWGANYNHLVFKK